MFKCAGVQLDHATQVRIGIQSEESHYIKASVCQTQSPDFIDSSDNVPGEVRCVPCRILCSTIKHVAMNQNQIHYLEGLLDRHTKYDFVDELDLLAHVKSISTYIPASVECTYSRVIQKIGLHSFEISLTNGRFDSMVLRLIDQSLGYVKGNVYPFPSALHMVDIDTINDIATNTMCMWSVSSIKAILDGWFHLDMLHGLTRMLSTCSTFSTCAMELNVASLIRLIVNSGGRCALTGAKLVLLCDDDTKPASFRQLAIDRKDITKGYTPNNSRLVCKGLVQPFIQPGHSTSYGQHFTTKYTNSDTRRRTEELMRITVQYMKDSMWSGMGNDTQAQLQTVVGDVIEEDKSQWLNQFNMQVK